MDKGNIFNLAKLSLALMAVLTAEAHNGTDMDGNRAHMSYYDEYMMCGKCTYGGASTTGDATKNWYKLTCTSGATNSSLWGTLNYECNSGCTGCGKMQPITIGEELDAVYKYGLASYNYGSSYSIRRLMVPASIQCCPQVIVDTEFADTECTGSATKINYSPAGCSVGNGNNKSLTYNSVMCGQTDGAAPTALRMDCEAGYYLTPTDVCPTSHSGCLLQTNQISNNPCITVPIGTKYNGSLLNMTGIRTTSTCQIDGTQQCLRLVFNSLYVAATMTTGTDNISGFSCSAANTGTTVGHSGASSILTSSWSSSYLVIVLAAAIGMITHG